MNSRSFDEVRKVNDGGGTKKRPLTASFELHRQTFTPLNGGPVFKRNEAVSFVVQYDTQQEMDE